MLFGLTVNGVCYDSVYAINLFVCLIVFVCCLVLVYRDGWPQTGCIGRCLGLGKLGEEGAVSVQKNTRCGVLVSTRSSRTALW